MKSEDGQIEMSEEILQEKRRRRESLPADTRLVVILSLFGIIPFVWITTVLKNNLASIIIDIIAVSIPIMELINYFRKKARLNYEISELEKQEYLFKLQRIKIPCSEYQFNRETPGYWTSHARNYSDDEIRELYLRYRINQIAGILVEQYDKTQLYEIKLKQFEASYIPLSFAHIPLTEIARAVQRNIETITLFLDFDGAFEQDNIKSQLLITVPHSDMIVDLLMCNRQLLDRADRLLERIANLVLKHYGDGGQALIAKLDEMLKEIDSIEQSALDKVS